MQTIARQLIFILSFLFISYAHSQSCEKLIWQDDFDGTTLNLESWSYQIGNGCPELCGWGNNEQQYYTDSEDNVKVENGNLVITAREDSMGGFEYTSARIHTKHKLDFRYGRVEARMKLPETQGLWPALWMLSTDDTYGGWPRSGEIDILELLGDEPTEIYGTVHTGLPWTIDGQKYSLPDSSSFADDFHVFSLDWTADTIKWFVDDVQYHEVTSDSLAPWAPFQENFHLLLNVAVGGNFPGFTDETTVLPQTMEVDYVRVYSKLDDAQIFGQVPVGGEEGVVYNTYDIEDANYVWTVPTGSTLVAGQGSNEVIIDWGCSEGDLGLVVETDCDTVLLSYPVSTFLEASIAGPLTTNQNNEGLEFSVPAITDGIYDWSVPEEVTIVNGAGTNSIVVDWGCDGGEVSVVTSGSCGMDTLSASVEIEKYSISGSSFVQENAEGQVYSIGPIPDVSYSWIVPVNATIVSGQGTNEIVVDFGPEAGILQAVVTGACGVKFYSFAIGNSTSNIFCDFDGIELEWGDFGGSVFEKIPNPFKEGINDSDHVGKTRKDPGSVGWAGIFADLSQEMDFTETPFVHMKVHSAAGGIVKFKLEDQTTGEEPMEFDITLPSSDEWVNMVWDFTSQPSGTFDRVALFFDFDDVDTTYWYFDDILGSTSTLLDVEVISEEEIKIFPNPSQGDINISLDKWTAGYQPLKIRLLNAQGQQVYQNLQFVDNGALRVELPVGSKGIHFLVLESEGLIYTKRVVLME